MADKLIGLLLAALGVLWAVKAFMDGHEPFVWTMASLSWLVGALYFDKEK